MMGLNHLRIDRAARPGRKGKAKMTTSTTTTAHANLNKLNRELDRRMVGRRREIRTMVVGLVSGQHTCLLGDPGTGKSFLARQFAKGLGYDPKQRGDYFELLLTKQTKDIEVLGAWKLNDVKQDEWNRKVDNKLPGATVALLDEIFKCNSGILNGLLTLLNEGLLHQDAGAFSSPLRAVVGCSNELPEEDENLEALWDRFTFRHWVDPVSTNLKGYKALKKLKRDTESGKVPAMPSCATIEDAALAAAEAKKVDITDAVDTALFAMVKELRKEGIPVSDRKLNQIEDALKANAWLDGCRAVSVMHFDILRDVVWTTPDQKKMANEIIDRHCVSPVREASKIVSAAVKMAEQLPESDKVETYAIDAVKERIERCIKELKVAQSERDRICAACTGQELELAEALTGNITAARNRAKALFGALTMKAMAG